MPRFAAGVVHFEKSVYPVKRDLFERLAGGQSPDALFVACSDSRVETAMVTQTEPGELFICRNAGNIIPPYSEQTGGMTASIEYAMEVLQVPHAVICGHTQCGAMAGAMALDTIAHLPHVSRWLGYARAAVAAADALGEGLSEEEQMLLLTEQNVLLQMQHLRTHPAVAARLARRELVIHGWVYDIVTGNVSAYDEAAGRFTPVEEHYGEQVRKHAAYFAQR
jgi:carbonic anhydrase